MTDEPWYRDGLRFRCARCGNCCSGFSGTVHVTGEEIAALAQHIGLPEADFRRFYTRILPGGHIALQEKPNDDCILFDPEQGCMAYDQRPRQCRTWPFWQEVVCSPETWAEETKHCPGMNQGDLYSAARIQQISADDGTIEDMPLWEEEAT